VWRNTLVQLAPLRSSIDAPSALALAGELPFVLATLGRRLGINYGLTYKLGNLEDQSTFTYRGEGWGLTHDGRRLIMSDGTPHLRFLDPESFEELGRVQVIDNGRPIEYLNELEFVNGEILANVWYENRIAVVSPDSGAVTGWIEMADLESRLVPPPDDRAAAVLNGIAYDAAGVRLFVTGKRWSRLFEVRLRPARTTVQGQ
jgi:glutaminyl-peptide cyclotransferase